MGLFERAMEHWEQGDRARAVRVLREVIAADPHHAEAHDHLGLAALERGRLAEAEQHFVDAIEAAAASLEANEGFISWREAANRPWLRAHAHLALVCRRTGRWLEAARLHEQLLRWSPNDDLGVRFVLGEEYHRLGRLERAASAHRVAGGHPRAAFGLGLALLQLGERPRSGRDTVSEADVALLHGIATNRYVVPMLLDEPWTPLPGRHGPLGDPDFAAELVRDTADLWRPRDLEHLGDLWDDARVRSWRGDLDDIGIALEHARDRQRRSLLDRQRRLVADVRIRKLAASRARPLPPDDDGIVADGASWITDMRHLVAATDPAEALPEDARRVAVHHGRIVEAVTASGGATAIETPIRCRRQKGGKACSGHLRAAREGAAIDWSCTRCRDSGRISGFEDTPWDLDDGWTDPGAFLGVPVSTEWYDELRNLPLGEARRPIARAVHHPDGAELRGTPEEYALLADAVDRAGAPALGDFLRTTLRPRSST